MARTALAEELPVVNRPEGVTYDTSLAVAADRWKTESASSKVTAYELIEGYEYVLFFPVSKVSESNVAGLDKSSNVSPTHLGVLSTTKDLRAPAVSAGTYMLTYRSAGLFKPEKVKNEAGESVESVDPLGDLAFNRELPHFILYDNNTIPVAAMPAASIETGKLSPGSCAVQEYRPSVEELELDPTLEPYDILRMEAIAPGRSSNKGFRIELPLRVAPGALEGWRY